jgi:hypothetical protein
VRVLDLVAGNERALDVADMLADPARHFPSLKELGHA